MAIWDERIARARTLADAHPAAAAMLAFYAQLAALQRSILHAAHARSIPTVEHFADAVDLDAACGSAAEVLGWLRRNAPEPLARAGVDAASLGPPAWRELMQRRLAQVEIDEPLGFIVEALLQPFAEAAARRWLGRDLPLLDASAMPERVARTSGGKLACCPVCGSAPVTAALREEGQGAKRTLVCSLCLTEWDFLRVVCPACDEARFEALPIYTAETIGGARVDACDTCRVYVKTVDLTKDGLAIPVVDDIATVALDLWAREAGYRRLCPNLLRL